MNVTHLTIRRTATEIRNYRSLAKIVWAIITLTSLILTTTYVTSVLYSRTGSFTVTVAKLDQLKYSISLSEHADFLDQTARLNCGGVEDITCISRDDISPDVDQIDGQHNGANYVAYTFYCKNTGNTPIDLYYDATIVNASKNIDAAAYVRLYVNQMDENGEFGRNYTDYARTRSDGTGPEKDTTPFVSLMTVTQNEIDGIPSGGIIKYTVVIWLEGDDPECVDDILGGNFKVDMKMKILNVGEES